MRKKIDSIEEEVNEIRLRIYEETKHMTIAELNEYVHKNTETLIKEYGFKVAVSANDV
ncbi:MAG: hypothetical protein LBI08_04200 [Methanomassiliicoccaceae archaeon]|jgi:hypothetical protein|nr:hypothetical protein [Methanomassiliicoccaceae archaeon]